MTTMKAAVIHEPGGPEVLEIEEPAGPRPEAGRGADPRQGLRAEPLRDVHPAGAVAGRALPAHPRHRGGRDRRGGTGRRVRRRSHRGDRHGRNGAAVRRELRRIHLRPGRPGPGGRGRCSLGGARRRPGDAADRLGFAVHRAAPHSRREPAGPRRHDLGGARGGRHRQGPWRHVARRPPATPPAPTCCGTSGADEVFIDDGAIAGQCGRRARTGSTRFSNSSAPRR